MEKPLEPRELILVVVRWAHAGAAVALVGGSTFCHLVLASAFRQDGALPDVGLERVERGFKELLDLSLIVFIISGGLLTFERLSSGAAGSAYVVILGLKIFLSVLLFRWAFQVRSRGWEGPEARLLVGSGFVVVLLAAVLKTLYESGLRA
jgi:uncharacterized membrane protein